MGGEAPSRSVPGAGSARRTHRSRASLPGVSLPVSVRLSSVPLPPGTAQLPPRCVTPRCRPVSAHPPLPPAPRAPRAPRAPVPLQLPVSAPPGTGGRSGAGRGRRDAISAKSGPGLNAGRPQ